MMASVRELPVRPDPAAGPERPDPKDIVAVVLADGSVRELRPSKDPVTSERPYATGSLSGPHWILWWERRTYR